MKPARQARRATGMHRFSGLLSTAAGLVIAANTPSLAQTASQAQEPNPSHSTASLDEERIGGMPFIEWTRITGDWGGFRTNLEESGFTIDSAYVSDWSSVFDGGIRNRSTYRSLTDVNLTVDLDRVVGLEGGTVFLDAYASSGRNGSNDVGDIQGYSNIDLDVHVREIAELWWDQTLFDDVIRFKIGKVDANSEFDFLETAGQFPQLLSRVHTDDIRLP